MNSTTTQAELEAVLTECLELLLERDAHLIEVDANERSISHRLAIYLQERFPDWHVDCEYNRNGHDPKTTRLPTTTTSTDDEDAVTVYPDIIVHRRNSNENLLVIEIKKSSSRRAPDFDYGKLNSYAQQPLCYQHALFLFIRTDDRFPERWRFEWFPTSV